ncbi:MAG: hypothetical protein Fur0041_22020 [Bacteroidia bacterium]
MKKYVFLAAAVMLGVTTLSAQKSKRTTAYMAFEHYKKDKDVSELDKAVLNINEAANHPDTKDDPQTWLYRGNIYMAVYQKDFNANMAAIKDVADAGKKQMMAYVSTPTTSLSEATTSYLKAKTLDTKKVYPGEIAKGLGDCYFYVQNVGIANYNQQKYAEAYPMFEFAIDISASNGKIDTNNTNNAANSAMYAKNYASSEKHFKKLTEYKYGKGNTWMMLARVYLNSGDSAKYKSTIAEGLKVYPSDADLLVEDVNIKLKENRSKEAVDQLTALIAQRPTDPDLHFVVGNVYDRMANPTGADGKPAAKPAEYEQYLGKAAEHYQKSIELKSNNFDAYYNLGVLYMNQSVEYYNRSQSTLKDAAKYNSMWEKPLPDAIKYLEKAHELDPKDMNTMLALKQCYGNIGNNDGFNKMKEEIKKAQNGGK